MTTRHVCHIEYYLAALGVGKLDPERPHDIVGPGNKFEWGVIRGFALQARDPMPDFNVEILPSLELHRIQYHHRRWNNPSQTNEADHVPEATADDMRLGAVDAICSMLEPRDYQGGAHTFKEIAELCEQNPPHKVNWLRELLLQVWDLPKPELGGISLEHIPNIGLPRHMHKAIVRRLDETMTQLFANRGRYAGQ